MEPPIVALIGGTASGKSRLAVELASWLIAHGQPAEVVNADSMLVYRGMNIGTAKPSLKERHGIPHHLIDICDIQERASVAHFQQLAREAIADIRNRSGVAILVGGSALYVRAILDNFEFPGGSEEVRARWERELEKIGAEALHQQLAAIAPESAATIEPGNGRRIVRALEVAELTGSHQPRLPSPEYLLSGVQQFGIEYSRSELDERIEQRVEQMWADGLVAEVSQLAQSGLAEAPTASRAIGYRQVLQYLAGQCSELEAKTAVKRATRRFLRKQLAWYRKDPRITWLPGGDRELERILSAVEWSG